MKLLFILDHFGSGGAQRQMVTLADKLSQKGQDITIYVYYPTINHFSSSINSDKIEVVSNQKKNRFSLSIIYNLYKLLKRKRYDCIVSFLSTPNVYAELMALSGMNIPVIASVRNSYSNVGIPFPRKIKEQFHRFADVVTVNTHYQRILMEQRYSWIRNKIVTIYNGVDTDLFHPSPYDQILKPIPEIIGVGTVRKLKNITGIIQAMAIFKENNGKCPIVRWAGRIPSEGEDHKEYLKANALISKYDLGSHWEWLGERKDIPDLLRQHDVLILGSFHEGLPNAICEAFASGLPVLASDVCEHPKLVKNGENGFLFDPYKPESIAHAIDLFLHTSQNERLKMGLNARKFAEREFCINKYTQSYESLFKRLIS